MANKKNFEDLILKLDTPNSTIAEKRLWRAVIAQACVDSKIKSQNLKRYKKTIDRAKDWLKDFDDDFKTVCDFADLDPDYVREKTSFLTDC